MEILIPVLLLTGIALLCAILLTVANVFFGIKEDEKYLAIRDCLPGANCGACGYSGCDSYAKALCDGSCKTNLCIPGGDKCAQGIACILGVEAEEVIEQVAYVACNGVCGATSKQYEYRGEPNCVAANLAYHVDKDCPYACLGYGDCVKVCPQEAIYIKDDIAHIDPKKCIGCGLCVHTCPNNIIKLIKDTTRVVVKCSNHDLGPITRKVCTNGCIACKKCEKTCPNGAIKVENNVAVIDYSLCTNCGECVKACPVKCIHEGNFICGAHN
jgi:RnfABCDGE-type electron transport complex B subunit